MKIDEHYCFAKADEALAPFNSAIDFAFSITDSDSRPQIRTYKVNTSKRGQPKRLLATYCPFCGKSLVATSNPGGDGA